MDDGMRIQLPYTYCSSLAGDDWSTSVEELGLDEGNMHPSKLVRFGYMAMSSSTGESLIASFEALRAALRIGNADSNLPF